MTIIMIGKCRDGMVARDVPRWKDQRTGLSASGITYDPCEKCGGKGCPKPAVDLEDESRR